MIESQGKGIRDIGEERNNYQEYRRGNVEGAVGFPNQTLAEVVLYIHSLEKRCFISRLISVARVCDVV